MNKQSQFWQEIEVRGQIVTRKSHMTNKKLQGKKSQYLVGKYTGNISKGINN